ncbi:MAG: ATP-binding protein [Candidatus Andersenbacteria bacterium]
MLGIFSISGLLILTTSVLMAVFMFFQGKRWLNVMWGTFCISVAFWGLGAFRIGAISEPGQALWWWKFAYAGVIFIPVLFTHFVYIFLGISRRWSIYLFYTLGVFYLLANLFTNFFIRDVRYIFNEFYYLTPTPLYTTFVVFIFLGLVIYTHTLLFRAYMNSRGEEKRRIQYFFLATLLGYLGGSFSFLPVYNFDIYPFLNLTVALYPIIMGYAIIRHRLMDIKIVLTQLFVLVLLAVILFQALVAPLGSQEQLVNVGVLIAIITVGILLVRSVMKEVQQREHIEGLYTELREANEHLKELMNIKTEFLQIASHQLRTPLTSLRGLLEMQATGGFDSLPAEERRKMQQDMFGAANNLNNIVNDLLDAMELEGGKLNFTWEQVDVSKLIQEAVDTLMPSYEKKGLSLAYNKPPALPKVEADEGYLRQVFLNIINNAEKYTEKGGLTITTTLKPGRIEIAFKDTGIGIDPEELPKLFGKFVRGKKSALVHTDGSGLGLFIIKKIVEEHHGSVTLESEGIGKGTTVRVMLPLKQTKNNNHVRP